MSAPSPDPKTQNHNQFRLWLLITYILLAGMAFFSAFGDFMVRIFFVPAMISAWRAYVLRPVSQRSNYSENDLHKERKYREQSQSSTDHGQTFKGAFFDGVKSWPVHLKIVRAIWLFIALVSAFVFSMVFFSRGSVDSQRYLQSAKDYYDTDQYDSAYANFRRVLNNDNQNAEALFGYGNTLFTKGYPDSSIYYYDRVLELEPAFYDAQYNKAWVFYQQKKYNESIEELNSLIESNPDYYGAYQLLGDCHYSTSNYDDALLNFETAYNNNWKNQWVCHVMGYLYDVKNDTERAVGLYEESLQYDENNAEVLKRLGELLPGERGEVYRQRFASLSK
jgi:tetratricopeptide (TPR) repeat protein